MSQKKLAVFISGFGSNLEIFLKNRARFADLLVVSSTASAYGLKRAEDHGVDRVVLPSKIDWAELQKILEERSIDLVFMAGFMKILPAAFVESWQGRLFNLHPSLLPKYKGLNSIQRAFEAGDDVGVTIHRVTVEVDSGQIVAQQVAVSRTEITQLSLAETIAKTHACEHRMVQDWIDSLGVS